MADLLTQVEVWFVPEKRDRYLRFGRPLRHRQIDAHRVLAYFAPGAVFGYCSWDTDRAERPVERFWILQAGNACSFLERIDGVSPGAHVLFETRSETARAKIAAVIDAMEDTGIDPADVCPDHWRHVHNRISTGLEPRPYTALRHRAWLLRRALDR